MKVGAGNKVICIDNYSYERRLTINKIYIVIRYEVRTYKNYVTVIDDCGYTYSYHEERFISLSENRRLKLKKL